MGTSGKNTTWKTVDIYLMGQEARDGCQRTVSLPGQAAPLNLTLQPGTKNNTYLTIKNARFYGENGAVITIPVTAIVHVEQAENAGRPGKKNRGIPWPLTLLAIIGVFVIILNGENESGPRGQNTGTDPAVTAAPSTPEPVRTDIPAVLSQEGWDSFGQPEYCPKLELFANGWCTLWVNLGNEYPGLNTTYEIYQYDNGSRAISCDVSGLYLDDPLGGRVYFLETAEGDWKYRGTQIGFTDISCRFAAAEPATVSVPVIPVQDPVPDSFVWATEGGADDLNIIWIDAGKAGFSFGIYRIFGYEQQVGFCAPDGSIYCFLNGVAQTGIEQADGLVRLWFAGPCAYLEFLAARGDSGYLRDYVGQTYTFQQGGV